MSEDQPGSRQLVKLSTANIRRGDNDRTVFDEDELRELSRSINQDGLAQPITVRPIYTCQSHYRDDIAGEAHECNYSTWRLVSTCPDCGTDWEDGSMYAKHYEIVAGERRFRACSHYLGWHEIPCIVQPMSDESASTIMLVENVVRVDLNPIDEANGYKKRIEKFGWSETEIARRAGVSPHKVANRLSLLKIVPEAQHMIKVGEMGVQFGETMSNLDNNRQRIALRYVVDNERPLLRVFKQIVGQLAMEQAQDTMFDIDSFMQSTIQTAEEKHARKYIQRFPVNPSLPMFEKRGSLGYSIETYIAHLISNGDMHSASVIGRLYEGLLSQAMCFPPEHSPLDEESITMAVTKYNIRLDKASEDLNDLSYISSDRFGNIEF